MRATDVEPNRMVAAQQAAKQFAEELTPGINLGLIAFGGTATVLVSPTTNRDATKAALDKLQFADRTATGEAIDTALQAIATAVSYTHLPEEEREIIYRMGVTPPQPKQILNPGDLLRLQGLAANSFVHHALVDYVVRVVFATRAPEQLGMNDVKSWIAFGASPRASLGIIAAARSLALVRGRDYVIPQDVIEVIPDVLRHRLVLTYDALADEISSEVVINRVLQTVALPQVNAVPQQGHSVAPAMPAAAAASGR